MTNGYGHHVPEVENPEKDVPRKPADSFNTGGASISPATPVQTANGCVGSDEPKPEKAE